MDRRIFLKVTAVTGAGTTLASCDAPVHQLVRFIPEETHVPGVAEWKPGVCPICQAGCGVLVRVMEGDAEVVRNGHAGVVAMGLAKKLEGNPEHPINRGALCARGQAAVQLTYHPDRLTRPRKRVGARGSGQFKDVSWEDAIAELLSKLEALIAAERRSALAFLGTPGASARADLVDEFLTRFGARPAARFELFDNDVLRRANELSFGRYQLPTFDLDQARLVLSLGADFLGTWNSPVSQGAAYGQMRQGRVGIRGRLIQVEPRMSQTGANADEWLPARPGTEGILALGLARVVMSENLRPAAGAGRAGALVDGWPAGLLDYTPEQVEKRTGVAAARVERLARQLANERPSVVIIGGAPLAHTNGLASALAVNALNALLGSVGEPGGVSFMPQVGRTNPPASRPALQMLLADLLSSERSPIDVLLLDGGVNPVFGSPQAWRTREALLKVPFIVSFAPFLDETSALADLVLPDHGFLEGWDERRPESGARVAVRTVAAPALRPLFDTRATADVLMEVGRRLGRPLELPWQTFEEMLASTFETVPETPEGDGWTVAKRHGGWWGAPATSAPVVRPRASTGEPPTPTPQRVGDPQFIGDQAAFPYHFLPYASQAFLDGSVAHLPWLQELPDVISTAMWSTWVELNPKTAARLEIRQGDLVEVTSPHGALRAPALVSPGLAPDVVAMPVGQGHEQFTRYASGRGANPVNILAPTAEPVTGALAWAATRVKIARISDPDGSLIMMAGSLHEHPEGGRD